MKHLNAICCCKRLAAAGKQFCKAVRREYLLNPPLLIKVEALALLRREDKGNGNASYAERTRETGILLMMDSVPCLQKSCRRGQ
jgi:hypothetical protein